MKKRKASKHRALFNKAKVIREATASLANDPKSDLARGYLRGLCDGCHGTENQEIAAAIHVARQVIIACKD